MSKPTQLSCKAEWEALKAEFISKIAEIDHMTPWSNIEPQWWLEMMAAEKAVREGGAK